jgi:hypothetical protein
MNTNLQILQAGEFMAFDTFDEGVVPGGLRSKSEIKTLICYLFYSVKERMSKDIIVSAIQNESLANYFETSSAFDDLVNNGNIEEYTGDDKEENETAYVLTDNGRLIADQLETNLAYTVKEKAYACATKLLAQKKIERDNSVDIVKTENGFDVRFRISGGEIDLLCFNLYAPSFEQALIMKKNFFENPSTFYSVMLALLTKDKESVGEALEDLYGIL